MSSSKKIQKIHFIEFRSKINTLVVKSIFPIYGGPLLATILADKGYEVRMFLEGTSDMRFKKMADCDLICIVLSLPAFNKAKEFALRLREERPHVPVIVGGPFVGLYPEMVLDFCNYAVRCEGDEILPRLVECLNMSGEVEEIEGLTFRRNGQVIQTPDADPPSIPRTVPDMKIIDGFQKATRGFGKIFKVQNMLQTSRGCQHKCRFCPTSKLFPGAYRCRDVESVIQEIRRKKKYNDWFLVVDNSFMGNKPRTRELLEAIIEEGLDVSLSVFERHEIGLESEMLHLMKKAGVDCLIVGVESLSNDNLAAFNKRQKKEDVLSSIKTLRKHEIHVVASLVFGYDGDTPDKANEIVEFITRNRLSMTLFPLHDICGEGNDKLVPVNRRFWTYYKQTSPGDTSFFDYFTGHFVTYFPKTMKPSTLQKCVLDIYTNVYTHKYILGSIFNRNIFGSLFGVYHGYSMRRMTNTIRRVASEQYLEYLESIERHLYDENEILIEERLEALDGIPLPPLVEECVDLQTYNVLILLGIIPGLVRHKFHQLSRKIVRRLEGGTGRTKTAFRTVPEQR